MVDFYTRAVLTNSSTLGCLASCKALPPLDWERKAGALTHGGVMEKRAIGIVR